MMFPARVSRPENRERRMKEEPSGLLGKMDRSENPGRSKGLEFVGQDTRKKTAKEKAPEISRDSSAEYHPTPSSFLRQKKDY